ncbi:porin [Methylocella silvestris]|uniref:Porin n=2 Tax=Methylocella silvestris TaxID=199596 RepID=A0A2J7TDP9_METSI|nr:porin [Methylocella silvestris]
MSNTTASGGSSPFASPHVRVCLTRTGAALTLGALLSMASAAFAQEGVGQAAPGASPEDVNPNLVVGLEKPVAKPGFNGPLASIFVPLAAQGYTFHALAIDFVQGNPSAGLVTGRYSNSAYFIVGGDADLGKIAGWQGASLHYENTFFGIVENLSIAPQIGDSTVGYQPPFTPPTAWLSIMTFEQKLFDDHLDFEIGKSHPDRYYALPNCNSINSCFQDILYENAGWTSPQRGVWGANLSYKFDVPVYAEAGVFSGSPGANSQTGYRWFNQEDPQGVIAMGEIGWKTTFATNPYPGAYSFTGFYNSQSHVDNNVATAFGGVAKTRNGTSGVVLQGDQVVWRADGGTEKNPTPTAISLYGSAGFALDSTVPISTSVYGGAKLMSPFAGRPADNFGVKFNWSQLNPNYNQFLAASNFVAGGSGAPFNRNKYIIEANAHIALPAGMAFEPVFQYVINPNSFFNPSTATRPKDGIYVGGTFIVPLGLMLGIAAPT